MVDWNIVQIFALNILLFFFLKFLQNIFEFKYCCFSPSIFENIVEICGPTFKIQGFSLYGNLYYWDIARTFPVQKSCAAFFAGTDSCLFTFSNGTKTCLFVFAGALKRPTGKNKKKVSIPTKKLKKEQVPKKKLVQNLLLIFNGKVPYNTNTVERNMAHLLLSCSQIFFWNWSHTEKILVSLNRCAWSFVKESI